MRERGATLIEMVLIIVLIGIIGAIAANAFLYASKSVMTANSVREAAQVNRLALDRMVREIRNVQSNRCVAVANANTFTFVDGQNNTIAYSWAGGAGNPLMRNADTLIGSVNNLTFTYYNSADPAVAIAVPTVCASPNTCSQTICATTNIWYMRIDLTTVSGGETVPLRSQVHPRNF